MKTVNIVISGPESTGKSTLAMGLASHYNTVFVPEYAREYIENINRPYTFADIEHIAQKQLAEFENHQAHANQILFLDTYLIITKVWFDVVFGKVPDWIDKTLKHTPIHLYLLCNTDIEWIPDSVRENGGEMRNVLFNRYLAEIMHYGFPYHIVSGVGNERLECAILAIEEFRKKWHSGK
jgi:NadR type nicotinamide-nucleotide adenylyltransferase